VDPYLVEASCLQAFEVGFEEVGLEGKVVFCIEGSFGICYLFYVRLAVYDVV